jgi:5-methylcytosine-specific restriction endonuclease McrA
MTYSEKLKDPRWQKKRLEILQRDNFTCCNCKRKDKELHVHHVVYIRGLDPWEYDQSLLTLCSECHAERHNAQNELLKCTVKLTCLQLQSLGTFIASFFDLKRMEEE